ncbi:filaggrin-like [Vidua macroura]|uniref:filaggrin-like n=1 Tax=Vidua macroura TaxID=187451 RepID=UPI0023A89BF7|nr:filaggrin-like [Vidua macroura]XP_053829462.1 filaggrin-like [Vidua macroura]
MASEEDLAERGTSSPAASTIQLPRAARPGASENLRCPICRAGNNDRASVTWRWHPFCFYCMVEWFHRRVESLIRQSSFPLTFHMVGDSNSEVHPIDESISSASHTQGEQAGSRSTGRCQHHSPGRQYRKSCSRRCSGCHGGSHGGSRRGRAQEKSRSRYPRRHHNGRARVQQAQGYNHSSSRRRRQSRAQNTARDKGRRTQRHVRALSRRRKRRQQEYQVSFIEPRAIRSRSRQRSHRSSSQTLREYLREMERDEGQALRHDWYIRASSGRRRRQQRGRQLSYRELQMTRSRTPQRFCSTLPLKESRRRMECYDRQIEQGIHASPRRSERLQQGRQASFIEPQMTRSRSRGRSRSTQHQTLRENLRRMERDISTSSGYRERHRRRRQVGFTKP